jgi:transketolase
VLCGSHAGVSIGEDGPSQMGLEDLAMFRSLVHSTVLYPSDAVCAERCVEAAAQTEGVVYIRTTRPKGKVLYGNDERFPVGGSKVLRSSDKDQVTLVAAGVTLYEALAAHEALAKEGVAARVIDLYSVKPLDTATLLKAARETRGVVTVEDHSVHGGLGEAVAAALSGQGRVHILGVDKISRSGSPSQLMADHGLDASAIVAAARRLL